MSAVPREASGQNLGVGSWPARRARLTPDALAWSFEGVDSTFDEVDRRVQLLAGALQENGVERGGRIAYMGGNHPALLEVLFAAGRIGAVAVLVNARLARHEAEYILTDSGATLLFHGAEQQSLVESLDSSMLPSLSKIINVDVTNDAATGNPAGTGEANSYRQFISSGDGREPGHVSVSLDEPCLLMYTSGTTGRPKGAVLSHGNIFFNDMNVLIETDLRANEVCLAAAPLYHIAGLNGLVLPVFLKGGRLVIMRQFRPEPALKLLESEGATCMFGVPAMLDALSQHRDFASADMTELRTLIVGGSPVPSRILRLWKERGVEIQQGYGLTETAPAVLKLGADDAERKIGSAGKPQFLVDARVVDLDGADVAPGETGEIVTRGPNVFSGYWGRAKDTEDAFSDGWFRTGDLASVDEEGFVFLRDRSKDMFISGGENIYPSEVENALLDVDGIAEAAVIGVADEKWGEVGVAFVVPAQGVSLTPEGILRGLEGRLARYKTPRRVEVVDALPRTSTGKLQKHVLREREETK